MAQNQIKDTLGFVWKITGGKNLRGGSSNDFCLFISQTQVDALCN
jgi:hypothetical protein